MPKNIRAVSNGIPEFCLTAIACAFVAAVIVVLNGPMDANRLLRVFVISYIYGFSIHLSIHFWGKHFEHKSSKLKYLLPALVGFVAATLLTVAIFVRHLNLTETKLSTFLYQVLLYALIATVVIMYLFIVNEQKTNMESRLKAAKLLQEKNEKELVHSELKLLQSQIEPHFLFNTLANIKALIRIDPIKSETMLDNLSVLLRKSLKQTRDGLNTLGSEIEFCESYLAIQQVRLSKQLTINIEIDEKVDLQQPYPPFLLLPIVENAVLHGIEPNSRSSNLKILVSNIDDSLVVSVSDDGVGLGNSSHFGHGIGLSSIRNRIDSLFGDRASLDVSDNPNAGVTAILRTPAMLAGAILES